MVLRILKFNTIFFLLSLLFFNISNANQIIGTPYIVDGDTIKINNFKIRFFGIDAPEIKQTCMLNNIEWECGKESKNFLINIIDNENIRCEVLNKDMYKRLICECFIKDKLVAMLYYYAYKYHKYFYEDDIANANLAYDEVISYGLNFLSSIA